jgi:hypothetical protein
VQIYINGVARLHLQHGMMTVRPAGVAAGAHGHSAQAGMDDAPHDGPRMPMGGGEAPRPSGLLVMAPLLFLALGGRRGDRFPVAAVMSGSKTRGLHGSTHKL